jgi:hypothetical protein
LAQRASQADPDRIADVGIAQILGMQLLADRASEVFGGAFQKDSGKSFDSLNHPLTPLIIPLFFFCLSRVRLWGFGDKEGRGG